MIVQDREWFLHEPQASGGRNEYTGARKGGSQSPPTASDTGNTIFNASAANAYYPYTAYTYPHPLTTGSGDTTPPVAPTNLRIEG